MQRQSRAGCGRRIATRLAMLGLVTAAVLVACSPAVALRPRTTPANAARLAVAQEGGPGSARAAALHDLTVPRILARHTAASGGAAAGAPSVAFHRIRTHHAVALGAQRSLAAVTLAALASIILVVVAVIVGESRQGARRRRAEVAAHPAAARGHQVTH